MTWLIMYVNYIYRDNLWTVRVPRKRDEVVLTTKTNRILPRRDFGPSQTSSFHRNEPGQEEHTNVVVASSSKLKAWENQQEQEQPHHHDISPLDRRSCVGKVYPTPDGQKVWLVTERQLPPGSVPKVVFAAL